MNTAAPPSHPDARHWPEILLPEGTAVTVGLAPSCTVRIQHASMSRHHLTLTRHGPLVEVQDAGSRFGTFVKGSQIQLGMLKAGDTIRLGSSPPYRFDGQALRVEVDAQGMALSLEGVCVVRGGSKRLDAVSLRIAPGTFVGLLGPSGAGKSLLLGCLSSTIEPSEGQISFDGLPVREYLDYFRSKIGFVTQEDLVDHALTVEENLRLSARIRVGTMPQKDFLALIDSRLETAGLGGDRRKRTGLLSGGQRKRLSVAIELLTTPRLLLLDEPTSGLDPDRQATLMEMLRRLSRQGTTVACSTHTLDTLDHFDRLVVLGLRGGTAFVAYDGPPDGLLAHFDVSTAIKLFGRLMHVEPGDSPSSVVPSESDTTGSMTRHPEPKGIAPVRRAASGRQLAQQAYVVLVRSLLGLWRDRTTMALGVAQPVLLAALVILSQQAQPRPVFIRFFLVVSALWLGMTLTVREIVKERKLFIRDRLVSLDPDAYFVGKVFSAALAVAVQAVLLLSTALCLVPLLLDDRTNPMPRQMLIDSPLVSSLIVLWLVGSGGALLGLFLSTLASSERAAVALLPMALLPQMLLSRVAFGDGGNLWSDPSPLGKIAMLGDYLTADNRSPQGIAIMVGSLPMLSRPGTALLDLLAVPHGQSGSSWDLLIEAFYFGLLLLSYGLAAYLAFRWRERRWVSLLR